MKCEEQFSKIYGQAPESVAFCPYRICPLGAHTDHQLGCVTGMALDKGIHLAYRPKRNGIIELYSLDFPKRAQFHVKSIPDQKTNDWADYLRGAALMLNERYPLEVGLAGVFEGSLPIGGLSSSAAVTLVFLSALCKVNRIAPSQMELLDFAKAAENKYVGVNCGKLDQSCELFCKQDTLLYLDTKDCSITQIPAPQNTPPWSIGIFFSGIQRTLVGSRFNMRVDECRSAAYAIMAYAGMDYGRFNDTVLRDVPYDTYTQFAHRLPPQWRRRADHYFSEQQRVQEGILAWQKGDLNDFGKLIFESGASSISNYETGSPELKALYDIMKHTDGIYGGRFSGAGFKGCCAAIIDPAFEDTIRQTITTQYLALFPQLKDDFSITFCKSANGLPPLN